MPLLDGEGKPTGKYSVKPDASGASRALQLIGMEAFGMFVERHEVGNPGDFARLTDEELRARVEADAEALGFDPVATETLLAMFKGEGPKH